jgi:hypothetical protein
MHNQRFNPKQLETAAVFMDGATSVEDKYSVLNRLSNTNSKIFTYISFIS